MVITYQGAERLREMITQQIPDAEYLHFGLERGSNPKNQSYAVVGSNLQNMLTVRDEAAAYFFGQDDLHFGLVRKLQAYGTTADGKTVGTHVETYADSRVGALLWMRREGSLVQAVHRSRIARIEGRKVVLLSRLPLGFAQVRIHERLDELLPQGATGAKGGHPNEEEKIWAEIVQAFLNEVGFASPNVLEGAFKMYPIVDDCLEIDPPVRQNLDAHVRVTNNTYTEVLSHWTSTLRDRVISLQEMQRAHFEPGKSKRTLERWRKRFRENTGAIHIHFWALDERGHRISKSDATYLIANSDFENAALRSYRDELRKKNIVWKSLHLTSTTPE
jgi:hypothetical protein